MVSNVETIQTLTGFAEKARVNTLSVENLENLVQASGKSGECATSAFYASHAPVEDYNYDDDMIGSADGYQAHNDPVDLGSDDGEEVLHDDGDEENETFSSYVALDDVTALEAAELDAIALLADTWDNDLDPETSAQMPTKQMYKGKGKCPFCPSHMSLEDRRRRLRELKAETECRACGRKGHWAHDRERAMSSSNMSTQNHVQLE